MNKLEDEKIKQIQIRYANQKDQELIKEIHYEKMSILVEINFACAFISAAINSYLFFLKIISKDDAVTLTIVFMLLVAGISYMFRAYDHSHDLKELSKREE